MIFIFQYIFEGLGPLISNIVTSWPNHIRRLNENGIKKMCRNILSLQQQLTNITMTRELSLDRARQYYEMLYLTPQVTFLQYFLKINFKSLVKFLR